MHIYLLNAVNFTFNLYFSTHISKIRNNLKVDFDTSMIFTPATQVYKKKFQIKVYKALFSL